MARQGQDPAQMAFTMHRTSRMMLLAGGVMLALAVVFLLVSEERLPSYALLAVAVLDLGVALVTRLLAERAERQAGARFGIEEH